MTGIHVVGCPPLLLSLPALRGRSSLRPFLTWPRARAYACSAQYPSPPSALRGAQSRWPPSFRACARPYPTELPRPSADSAGLSALSSCLDDRSLLGTEPVSFCPLFPQKRVVSHQQRRDGRSHAAHAAETAESTLESRPSYCICIIVKSLKCMCS